MGKAFEFLGGVDRQLELVLAVVGGGADLLLPVVGHRQVVELADAIGEPGAALTLWDQIAVASSSNATAIRRRSGASTASS
jgi:hypothetical protein